MFGWGGATRIYLAAGATDMRKGFEGLYGMARDRLSCDPLSGHVFLFANALPVAATGAGARPDTSTASNAFLPLGACRSRRLRYRPRVLNPNPRSRQNSIRLNPLDSYSATICSTSCRFRRRRPAHTCSSFMHLLHH